MGRKKKITKKTELPIEEPKTETAQSIGYQGKITVKIAKGKKILSSREYYNTGRSGLFKFICNCLAGAYSSTAGPKKIMLFNKESNEEPDSTFSENYWKNRSSLTPYITFGVAPVVKKATTSETDQSYTVTYHFIIPYLYINGTEVYKAALYATNPNTTDGDILAWYRFTTVENGKTAWNPIKIDGDKTSYSIILEWTMTVDNKSTTN